MADADSLVFAKRRRKENVKKKGKTEGETRRRENVRGRGEDTGVKSWAGSGTGSARPGLRSALPKPVPCTSGGLMDGVQGLVHLLV